MRDRIAFALGNGAGCHASPGGFLPGLVQLDRCRAVPGPLRAGTTPGMADLNRRRGAVGMIEVDDLAQSRHVLVVVDAGAAMGDAAVARHACRLDEAERNAAGGEARMVLVVPVL